MNEIPPRVKSNWDEMHGKFPKDEEELHKAMALQPLREPTIFFLGGKAIPYDVRIIHKRQWALARIGAAKRENNSFRC